MAENQNILQKQNLLNNYKKKLNEEISNKIRQDLNDRITARAVIIENRKNDTYMGKSLEELWQEVKQSSDRLIQEGMVGYDDWKAAMSKILASNINLIIALMGEQIVEEDIVGPIINRVDSLVTNELKIRLKMRQYNIGEGSKLPTTEKELDERLEKFQELADKWDIDLDEQLENRQAMRPG